MKIADAVAKCGRTETLKSFMDAHPDEVFTPAELRANLPDVPSVPRHVPAGYRTGTGPCMLYGCPAAIAAYERAVKVQQRGKGRRS